MMRRHHQTNHDDATQSPTVLFDHAAEDAAGRLALLRSLTPAATGLGQRRHNALVRLLEQITGAAFSDGHETEARSRVLARSAGRSRSTVYRILSDASALGLIETEQRVGTVNQTISSKRSIVWRRVRELVEVSRAANGSKANGTRAPQMGHPRPKWDTGAPSGTPKILTTHTTHTFIKRPEGADVLQTGRGSDSRSNQPRTSQPRPNASRPMVAPVHHVAVDAIRDEAGRVFEAIGYTGDQGQTVWAAVAAANVGVIDASSLWRAIGRAKGKRDPVAYFRTTLAEGLGVELPELTRMLQSVRVTPKLPATPPARRFRDLQAERAAGVPRPTFRTVGPDDGQRQTDEARRRVLRDLHAMAANEGGNR